MHAGTTEYTGLGTTPYEVTPEQLGPNYDSQKAREEARRFIDLLERTFPDAPEGARFKVESNPHDFGTYYDVVLVVPETDDGYAYGSLVDSFTPASWDVPAGVPRFVPKPANDSCTVCGAGDCDLAFVAHRGMARVEWACPGCDENLNAKPWVMREGDEGMTDVEGSMLEASYAEDWLGEDLP